MKGLAAINELHFDNAKWHKLTTLFTATINIA
jgi:hypothetical protein